jgi:hypothetical protein
MRRRRKRKVGEAEILMGHAVTNAARAALAAIRAEDARDRSTIASEAAAQRAEEARRAPSKEPLVELRGPLDPLLARPLHAWCRSS